MAVELVLGDGGAVSPGEEVRLGLAVTNRGSVVDEVSLSVLGDAVPWAEVQPATLALFPGDTGHATVRLAPPPEGGPMAGPVAVGVLACSRETGERMVAETTVTVAAAVSLDLRLLPVTSHGRRRATHRLLVRNTGNTAVPVSIEAIDPDQLLELQLTPRSAEIGAGDEASFTIRLRSTDRAVPHVPFTVTATTPGTEPISTGGAFARRRGRSLVPLVLVAAVALIAVVLLTRSGEDSRAVVLSGGSGPDPSTTVAGVAPSQSPAVTATGDAGVGVPAPAPGLVPDRDGGTGDLPPPPGTVGPVPTMTTIGPLPKIPTPTTAPPPNAATCSHSNLIVNGSFEGGLSSWTVKAGAPRTVAYGTPDYQARPADYLGGSYAFGGPGASAGVSAVIEQVVSLAPCQAGIAAGGKAMNFGGWLGGYRQQQDTVRLVLSYRAGARPLDQACTLLGPTAADRGGATTMIEIGAPLCPIPAAATVAVLEVSFTSDGTGVESDGSYDNAYIYVG